eukprot:TRINITY_DN49224_c0_g1_i1.p1 TRINITY_DN49224_c0_g1~~TRINITY_DN49224_c0_g1_i1.p1  ORF type:complete len:307 (+),score=63.32 TRINITY_DN49224_c0_g1_i1:60-923(+)
MLAGRQLRRSWPGNVKHALLGLRTRTSAAADHVGRLRFELAAAYRLCAKHGLNEGICNHLTVTIDEACTHFLVIPYGVSWELVQPEQLVLVDSSGNILEGKGEVETSAMTIHAAVHSACGPSGSAVFHTHMPWATTMCALKPEYGGRLLQVHQNCCRFFERVEYDERFGGFAEDMTEARSIARRFREAKDNDFPRAVLLANHGVVVIGRNIAEAWDDLYYLERACQIQVKALMAAGGDVSRLKLIDDSTAALTRSQVLKGFPMYASNHLESGIAELQRDDPLFAMTE